jgi:hypothetical protein
VLVIRDAQMEVLNHAAVCRWLVRYLQKAYPEQASRLGAAGLAGFVEQASEKARSHRFSTDQEIRKYVHVAFVLGVDFETRPDCHWAARILNNPDYHDGAAQLRALEDEMVKRLRPASPVPSKKAQA